MACQSSPEQREEQIIWSSSEVSQTEARARRTRKRVPGTCARIAGQPEESTMGMSLQSQVLTFPFGILFFFFLSVSSACKVPGQGANLCHTAATQAVAVTRLDP